MSTVSLLFLLSLLANPLHPPLPPACFTLARFARFLFRVRVNREAGNSLVYNRRLCLSETSDVFSPYVTVSLIPYMDYNQHVAYYLNQTSFSTSFKATICF